MNDDPRCSACDGPVSATALYCLHCGADLDDEPPGSTPNERATRPTASPDVTANSAADRRLDPDGLLDGSLTLLVGLGGGAIVGVLTFLLVGIATQSGGSIVPAGLAWLAGTGYFATRERVGEALKYGCYAVALLLVLLPVISFAPAVKGGNFAGRVFLFLVAELLFGVFAIVLAGIGHVAGRK